jgi:c-di-GMP-binding flagellar brake protein YcgR
MVTFSPNATEVETTAIAEKVVKSREVRAEDPFICVDVPPPEKVRRRRRRRRTSMEEILERARDNLAKVEMTLEE